MSSHDSRTDGHGGHVLIIGAGLSGLAAAQGFKKHGISFSVFERDACASYRPQGYRIKTFPPTDADLKYLLPEEVFQAFKDTCAECEFGECTLNAINGMVISSRRASRPQPSCVDRDVLRNVLLTGIQDHVHYDHDFSHFVLSANGSEVVAHFKGGEIHTGNLIIGADGVNSRVRKQHIPGHHSVDTQGACIYGKTPLNDELLSRFPRCASSWLIAVKEDAPILSQITRGYNDVVSMVLQPVRFHNRDKAPAGIPIPEDYVYWVLLFRRRVLDDPNLLSRGSLIGEKACELSLQITAEWNPGVRALLELQDVPRSVGIPLLSADPNLVSWEPSACVTVMGDAVHAMPPTGAQGAITALKDATILVRTLVDQGMTRDSIVQYENDLRLRIKATIEKAWMAAGILFNMQEAVEIQTVKKDS